MYKPSDASSFSSPLSFLPLIYSSIYAIVNLQTFTPGLRIWC